MTARCAWAGEDPLYRAYHDGEWGVPLRDDTRLFELLVLEGAQAGLSWYTVLKKRPAYREAFAGFDPQRVATFGAAEIDAMLGNAGLIRHRGKLEAAVGNARAVLELQAAHGSFSDWLWGFVDGRPLQNAWRSLAEVPAQTPASQALSRELMRRGCRFVGPTIAYAFMQAAGLVNDHTVDCFRHAEVAALAR
ncbi:DNA-3-methyladenine glycosylase I [Plasticicumulans lactativorans]|uniref:DNA-3-methyladenine glycosylase I n=1 Tax=Plasticicumulans lactativorans TaxID=1133106 RepID=A0A4R2L1S8_9GAMM|nr:DNA-3-methyladenine glycosylase I [Plasticicumulans lactativorans]TCO79572.1 DNA-3-methyladenine glycosylase I [Plasticicumulans lactativorans]